MSGPPTRRLLHETSAESSAESAAPEEQDARDEFVAISDKSVPWCRYNIQDMASIQSALSEDACNVFLQAYTKYWHGKCKGLPGDDAKLRRLCCAISMTAEKWEAAKAEVFDGKLFFERDGSWHNMDARNEYARSQEKSVKSTDAINKRWKDYRKEKKVEWQRAKQAQKLKADTDV